MHSSTLNKTLRVNKYAIYLSTPNPGKMMNTKAEIQFTLFMSEVQNFLQAIQVLLTIPSFSLRSKMFAEKVQAHRDAAIANHDDKKTKDTEEAKAKFYSLSREKITKEFDSLIKYIVNKINNASNSNSNSDSEISKWIENIRTKQSELSKLQGSIVKRISVEGYDLIKDYRESLGELADALSQQFQQLDQIYVTDGLFSLLSEELKLQIFLDLSVKDAGRLAAVNHSWNYSLNNNLLWKNYCKQLSIFKRLAIQDNDEYKQQFKKVTATEELFFSGSISLYVHQKSKSFKSPQEMEFSDLKRAYTYNAISSGEDSFTKAEGAMYGWCQNQYKIHAVMHVSLPIKIYEQAIQKKLTLEHLPDIDKYIVSFTYEDRINKTMVTITNPHSKAAETTVDQQVSNNNVKL